MEEVKKRWTFRGLANSLGFLLWKPWKSYSKWPYCFWDVSVWTKVVDWPPKWWTEQHQLEPKKCKNKTKWVIILAGFCHWKFSTAWEMPPSCYNVWNSPFRKTNGLTTEPNVFTSHMRQTCIHACPHVGLCLDVCACVCVRMFETGNWGVGKKKSLLVDPVQGDDWPQRDHRVRGASPQPAWGNKSGMSQPGTKQAPALWQRIHGTKTDKQTDAYTHMYTIIRACMHAGKHPLLFSAHIQTQQPVNLLWYILFPCIISSHTDKTKIDILHSLFFSQRVYKRAQGPVIQGLPNFFCSINPKQ